MDVRARAEVANALLLLFADLSRHKTKIPKSQTRAAVGCVHMSPMLVRMFEAEGLLDNNLRVFDNGDPACLGRTALVDPQTILGHSKALLRRVRILLIALP